MTFANPIALWLLPVLPPAVGLFLWWSWKKRQALMTRFIQQRLLQGLVSGVSAARQKVRAACLVLAVACILLALARPQWGFTWREVKQKGVDIVVALDISKSMLAEDIAPNRLARAKLAALDLLQQARSDRLGLVAFAGSAYLQCPLTIDDVAFRQSVEALNVQSMSSPGTALAEAIETALTAFKEGDNHKVLVLMSDGEDQESSDAAVAAATKAAAAGLRIYTIGIGTPEGELLRIKNSQGQQDYIRDEQGNVVKSHLDETTLQKIASASEGGFYLRLSGAKTIDTLYREGLSRLPKSEHQERLVKQLHERFYWPLAMGILLLLMEMLLPERRREKARRQNRGASSRSLAAATALVLIMLSPALLHASPARALRDYKSGKYDEALQEYETLLKRKGEDPRLHFNAGAAAYRDGQYEEAARQFNAALSTPDLKLQELAYYNRGNAQYYLGERNPDASKRTENWEKALKDFESTLKLNPQDADAKFNQQYVKRRLEELKQQQQQQQSKDQNKDQQQNQEQNQQQQSQKQEQQRDQQQQQSQANNQQQQQQQQANNQKEQQPAQQQQAQQQPGKDEKKEQEQANAQPSPEQDPNQKKEEQAAAKPGQMTPEQARQLLDAQKGEEKMLPMQLEGKPTDAKRAVRDW